MSSKNEGMLMVGQGLYAMFAQAVLFPYLARNIGCLKTFRITVVTWPLLYFLVPYTVLLPNRLQLVGVSFCLLWRTTAQALTYPPNNIMLTNSAPSMLVLGAINGVAGSTASLCRAFGPTVTGFIHSKGLSIGVSGLSWWITGIICALGALESLLMEEVTIEDRLMEVVDEEAVAAADDHIIISPLTIDAAIVAVSDRITKDHATAGKMSFASDVGQVEA